jgi:hypothetical protein
LTKDSFLEHRSGILQLLRRNVHEPLIPLLGKRSGYNNPDDDDGVVVSKRAACANAGLDWVTTKEDDRRDHDVLPQCALYIDIEVQSVVDAGDHVVAICRARKSGTWTNDRLRWQEESGPPLPPLDAPEVMYSGWLREKKII